jgi:hypothetical protein
MSYGAVRPDDKVWLFYMEGPAVEVRVLAVRRQHMDVEASPGWTTVLGRKPVTVSRATGQSASGQEWIRTEQELAAQASRPHR